MIFVQPLQTFSFNYTAFDQNPGLYVAFNVYDVTSGTAVFVSKLNASYSDFGAYLGDLIPQIDTRYLIIGVVYTDNTYTVVDTDRSPTAEVYQTVQSSIMSTGFAYPSYDLASGLHVRASVYRMTSGTPVFASTAVMSEVAFGVYYGEYTGVLTNTYQIIGVVYTDGTFTTPDPDRAASCDEFESINLVPNLLVLGPATLRNNTSEFSTSLNPPIHFTQGDDVVLSLTAVDGDLNPIDLTGATFSTFIHGTNGVVDIFPNSQHTANPDQVSNEGQFTLALSAADTLSCGLGNHKEILTTVTIGATSVMFRGANLLQVYSPVPFE